MINTEAPYGITSGLVKFTNLEFLQADDELLDKEFLKQAPERIHVFSILGGEGGHNLKFKSC